MNTNLEHWEGIGNRLQVPEKEWAPIEFPGLGRAFFLCSAPNQPVAVGRKVQRSQLGIVRMIVKVDYSQRSH